MKRTDLRSAREEQRRRGNREIILRAAEAVVLRKGFAAAAMDDIAAEAQFSKATLYRYFRNKAEIVYEIAYLFVEDMDVRLREVRGRDASASNRVAATVRALLLFLAEKENLTRAFVVDRSFLSLVEVFMSRQDRPGADAEKKFLQRIRIRRRDMIEGTRALVGEGVASGEFRPLDVAAAATFVGAVVQGYFAEKFWSDAKTRIEDDAEKIADFILHGIAHPGRISRSLA